MGVDSKYPKNICNFCLRDLLVAEKLKLTFENSQKFLTNFWTEELPKLAIKSEPCDDYEEMDEPIDVNDDKPGENFECTEYTFSENLEKEIASKMEEERKKCEEDAKGHNDGKDEDEDDGEDEDGDEPMPEPKEKFFFYRNPEGQIVCGHCNKIMANKKSLLRHIREVHIKKENFKCDICKKGNITQD